MGEATHLGKASTEISLRTDPRPVARYVSGATVHEEALIDTRWLSRYWSASGQVQRENVAEKLPGVSALEYPLAAFDLEIDGQDLRGRWDHVASTERAGSRPDTREAVVSLRHQLRPVTVDVVTRLDGTDILTRWLEIANTGQSPAALARVSPWAGVLWSWLPRLRYSEMPPHAEEAFELGAFRGVQQGTEGDFRWETLPRGWRRIESTSGHSGFGNPFFVLRNRMTGETAIGSLAWSGNWYAEFWCDPARGLADNIERGMSLAFRMGPMGPAPLRMIAPGEKVRTPEMHLGILHAGPDDCIAAWHAHLRASVIPPRPAGQAYHAIAGRVVEHTGPWMQREIDIAAEMGADAFMVDAGWYGDEFSGWWERRGDWWQGSWIDLAAVRGHCHEKKLKFGLWMEPESAGPTSRLLAEHPEWMQAPDGIPPSFKGGGMLDLSHPDAASFMRQAILRTIREHRLDFFKIDYNVRPNEGSTRQRGGFAEHEQWRHYETLYAIFDEIRRALPDVTLECCASGGARNDLGMLSRCHYACESDFSCFPRSIRAINGLTLLLPPEAICYYHNHMAPAHLMADLDTHLRVALFALPIFVGFGGQDADRGTDYFRKTRRYIKLIREVTGPLLAGRPRVFHHTPDIGLAAPADWCVLEYSAADRTRGYAGIFRLESGAGAYCFKPRGIDPARRYALTLDNSAATVELAGSEWLWRGIPVALDAANTSELLLWEALP